MYVLEIFLLAAGITVNEAIRQGTPQPWINDTRNDCAECLIKRNYNCGSTVCEIGVYEDKLYIDAFINDCFAVDQLDQRVIDEFLCLFRAGNASWTVELEKLVQVIYGLGLWTNKGFATNTPCSLAPQTTSQETRHHTERATVNIHSPVINHISKNARYFSSLKYRCPINNTITWRETFRYCGRKDILVKKTSCVCVEDIGVYAETKLCFDKYGYKDSSCETKLFHPCDCNTTLLTLSVTSTYQKETASAMKIKIPTLSLNNMTTNLPTHSTHNSDIFNYQNGLKLAIIILCACVVVLLLAIVVYCSWRLCCKVQPVEEEDAHSLQPTDTSVAPNEMNQPNGESSHLEAGYFCMGGAGDSIYHTIGISYLRSESLPTSTDADSIVPPLPMRLFSVSSRALESPTRVGGLPQRTTLNSSSCSSPNHLDVNDHLEISDGTYTTVASKPEEQAYEIPIPNDEQKKRPPDYDYEVELCELNADKDNDDSNKDIRINPLYATSEDEM